LTLGLRYENFGQVANALLYPALRIRPGKISGAESREHGQQGFGPAFEAGLVATRVTRSITVVPLRRRETVWRAAAG
jgi:hypothetical protein